MVSSAAQASEAYEPEQIMSWSEFAKNNGLNDTPDHWQSNIADFFTGIKGKLKSEYESYLQNVNNRNEAKAVQSARAWEEYMSSTAYSRAFKDLERSGINPYLLLNSGSAPATSTGSSSKASYSASSMKETKSNTKGRDFALILLAIARLAAAL